MRVEVSGQRFTFPLVCACCGVAADDHLTVSTSKPYGKKTKSMLWNIPHCSTCARHSRLATWAGSLGRLSVAVLLITFGMGLSSMGQIRFISPELASKVEFIGLAVLGVLVAVSLTLVRLAKGLCTSDCLGFRPAVRYLGWYGTCHSFEIQSESYAFAFMKANERKLVNVHPVVQAKLAAGAEAGSAQFVQKRVG